MKRKVLSLVVIATLLTTMAQATTIFVAGDSTAANYPKYRMPQYGWAQALSQFVKTGVKVDNMAMGGRSTKSFIDEGRWDKLIKKVQPGDFVLVQFGHNDQKKNDVKRYASPEKVYPENLTKFINEVKAKKANIIIINSITRRFFIPSQPTKLKYSLGKYPKVAEEVAKKNNVPFINMNKSTRAYVEKLGPVDSIKLYNHVPEGNKVFKKGHKDDTHLNVYGAKIFAGLFVDEVKAKKLELAKYLK